MTKKLRTSYKGFASSLRLVASVGRRAGSATGAITRGISFAQVRVQPSERKALGPRFRGDDEEECVVSQLCVCGRDCRALRSSLFQVPLGRGEQAEDQPRAPHAGACTEARAFAQGTRMCPKRTPQPARGVCRAGMPGKPRTRGCLSLGYFSLDKLKRSNSAARMADETHRDVSRFSRRRRRPSKAKANGFPLPRE